MRSICFRAILDMIRKKLSAQILFLVLCTSFSTVRAEDLSAMGKLRRGVIRSTVVTDFYRSELYFGRSIPGGAVVSDEEWEKFLAEVVTPRFPDGFTILKATGQYREKDGKIDKEDSNVLVFLYPKSKLTASRRKIEEIRRAYVRQFRQESVLRVDFKLPVKVSF